MDDFISVASQTVSSQTHTSTKRTRPLALHHQRTTKQQSHARSSSRGSTLRSQRVTWPSLSEMSTHVIMEQSRSLYLPCCSRWSSLGTERRARPLPLSTGRGGVMSGTPTSDWHHLKKTRFVIESLLASWGCNWHTHTHTHTHSRTQTHSCSKERERQGMMGRERERIKSSLSLSVCLHLFLCAIGVIVSASRCWLSSIWLKKFRRKRKTAGEREKEWHTWGIYSYISLIIYIYILSACVWEREREREREREFVQLQLVVLLRLRLSLLSQPIMRRAWVEVQPITGTLVLHGPIMFQSGHHKSAEGETEVENQWPGPLKHSNSSQQQELSQYSSYI